MAYINSDVYENGLTHSILSGGNTDNGHTVVVLTDNASLKILKGDNILAVSEARLCDSGVNNSDELKTASGATNYIGSYATGSKQLNIDAIPYCRTQTIKGGQANGFAVVHIKNGSPAQQTAYTKIVNGTSEDVVFAGFAKDKIAAGTVIISGALNSPVTLNADSNFMFGGAVINFTEA